MAERQQEMNEAQRHLDNAKLDVTQFMIGVCTGDAVPDAEIFTADGDAVSLASQWADKPALVVTGSMTCPPC